MDSCEVVILVIHSKFVLYPLDPRALGWVDSPSTSTPSHPYSLLIEIQCGGRREGGADGITRKAAEFPLKRSHKPIDCNGETRGGDWHHSFLFECILPTTLCCKIAAIQSGSGRPTSIRPLMALLYCRSSETSLIVTHKPVFHQFTI